jgi:EAL domain-containing protein (putative c-di-GMP-specific phosphodiesterase class I)
MIRGALGIATAEGSGLIEPIGDWVIDERVETAEQLEFLAAHGCALAQGFHLARPVPAADVTELLCRAARAPDHRV